MRKKLPENLKGEPCTVAVDSSRCLRVRFNRSGCRSCTRRCQKDAITVGRTLSIEDDSCTGCMLCVAECPSDALTAEEFSFAFTLSALRKSDAPVLGCTGGGDMPAHEKAPCLGILSEEHIIALSTLVPKPVQINLAGCEDCANGFIVTALMERTGNVARKTSLGKDRIILIEKNSDLDYTETHYDRRGFFRAFKTLSLKGTSSLIRSLQDEKPAMSFSRKILPVRRWLLNSVLSTEEGREHREALLRNYFFDLTVDDTCNLCYACMGVCPSGAIRIERDRPEAGVMFNSSLCSGCELCTGFCMLGSITLNKGFTGTEPSVFQTAGGAQKSDE